MKASLLLCALAGLPVLAQIPSSAPVGPGPAKAAEPFAFADFTWLNGNPRTKEAVLDSKYFTGEFRADVNAVYSFNHPQDHTGRRFGTNTSQHGPCRSTGFRWIWPLTHWMCA